MKLIEIALASSWEKFPDKIVLKTPTERSEFFVKKVDSTLIEIETARTNAKIKIPHESFLRTLSFLVEKNHHNKDSFCEIQSNFNNPGSLSQAAQLLSRTQTIQYVLPILQHMGLVSIDGNIPSKTWLA